VSARFDAILFDAGGVLVVPDPVGIGTALAPYVSFSIAQGIRAHYAGMRALETSLRALHADPGTLEQQSWRAYRRGYCVAVGVVGDQLDDAVRAMASVFSPLIWHHRVEAAVAALWRLHKTGLPMGVVSNASGQIEAVLRNEGVCQVGPGAGVPVRCVVDSHVVGIAKPDPAIFAPALHALAVDPSRVAYVGDSVVNDVGGAERAGIHPLHLDPFDDHPDAEHERITSLSQLLNWV
jgi:FMN phosphatase YigB (HAD superfamily)